MVEQLARDKKLSGFKTRRLGQLQKKFTPRKPKATTERVSQRELMAERRKVEKDITIDYSRQNKRRRGRFKNNPAGFCRFYFPGVFSNPFRPYQLDIISDLVGCIKYGSLKSVADSRGGGKSSIVKAVGGVWAPSYGHLKWFVPIEANFEEAQETLDDIKSYYEEPEDPDAKDLFGDDFPEICQPVRALEGSSRRGEGQMAGGVRTRIIWGTKKIRLPIVKGSLASGTRVTPKSAEKAIRGLAKGSRRPDFVWLNDLETDETARSAVMTKKIRENIERGVMGLSGQSSSVGIIMIGTIINKRCLMAQFTDPLKNPIWRGVRYRFFIKWPTRSDLWEKYIDTMERKGVDDSNELYLANREEMDAGAEVSNPNRYNKVEGAAGEPLEYSAIQKGYNEIVKMKLPGFLCEYQNDPPEDDTDLAIMESGLVAEKVNGFVKGESPPGITKTTWSFDVHDTRIFWSIMDFKPGFAGYSVDYGVYRVNSPLAGSVTDDEKQDQVELAILEALEGLRVELLSVYHYDILHIDAGYKSSVVYKAIQAFKDNMSFPSRGMSSRAGKYTAPKPKTKGVRFIGEGFHQSYLPNDNIWITLFDADKWKHHVQDGFRVTKVNQPGSISLFGDEPFVHRAIAEHICDEQWNAEKEKFEGPDGKRPRNNHWLDCLAGCCMGAAMCGIKLIVTPPRPRKSKSIQPTAGTQAGKTKLRMRY